MKLDLNTEGCQGHGRCYSMAPALFDADDEGHSVLLISEVPEDQYAAARDATASCPEEVIDLYE